MHFLSPDLEQYAELHTAPEPAYLRELAEVTRTSIDMPMMLSGHVQGRFLSLMSKLLAPRLVLDIGTFTGYSALCGTGTRASSATTRTPACRVCCSRSSAGTSSRRRTGTIV